MMNFLNLAIDNTINNGNLSTSSIPISTFSVDVVEIVIDNASKAHFDSADRLPDKEVERMTDVQSVDCSANEAYLRRRLTAFNRGLQKLINCQVSNEVKSNLREELDELKLSFGLFLDHFRQGSIF